MILLPKAERRTHLENTSFITLPVTLLNKIIVDPKEGMVCDLVGFHEIIFYLLSLLSRLSWLL